MYKKIFIALVCCFIALNITSCGKKSKLVVKEDSNYPHAYPTE